MASSQFGAAVSLHLGSKSFLGSQLISSRTSALPPRTKPLCSVSVRAATALAPSFTTLKPLGDRVLVKIQSVEKKSAGGILLPTTAQSKPQGGEVVAVGDGRTFGDKKVALSVQTGKNIVYSKYAGTEVEFNGINHVLLKEDDIVGFLETEDIKDLQPLNDRVLIEVAEAEDKSVGGVLLTESAKEKPVVGTVRAVGPGALGEDGVRKPLELVTGSTVMYSKYAGSDFKSKDSIQYVVLKAPDVLAVLS
uniref:20 kDa chaperonin, chloroplastic n=1 Tax=Hymenophyllum caudiculatum TaxID=295381 RepID=A0A2P1JJ44_9MONI|nr:chloroplast 20 kDa chaperonin [Hymenophyllum caudiculatum]